MSAMSNSATNLDHEAFMRHFCRAYPALRRFVLAHVPDFHEAEDACQKVSLVLWSKFPEFDPTMSFESWTFGVARREVLKNLRSAARSKVVFAGDLADKLERRVLAPAPPGKERQRFLDQCLGKLPDRLRTAVALRYESNLPAEQAAGRMGISINALAILLCRARRALADCLRRLAGAEGPIGGRA